eukprot:NODE_4463_length_783_cov_52.100610_g4304_i0.p1 GENE.NODE_4463_length_783_cov_52.100610_g4304_i0~~NODE_4463_length_783_cov_52.100610_g4304_i0.p1  ORF type:complete len:253 (+),score=102.44 NODE_4463_length_783_cov_52.100610_g4304_i0:47-760(+)
MHCWLLVLMVLVGSAVSSDVPGVLALDSITFGKLVGREYDVLVKFDKQYPYGDKEDAFKEFASRIGGISAPALLLAQVGVQDYGDKLNDDLRERFSIKADDFPAFRLFPKGALTPVPYTGEVTSDALTRFLKEQLNLYIGLPGCLEAFDGLAKGFGALDAATQQRRLQEADAMLLTLTAQDQPSGKFYVGVMKKVVSQGAHFPASEKLRLEKLLQSKITEDKKKQFRHKLNILPSFS